MSQPAHRPAQSAVADAGLSVGVVTTLSRCLGLLRDIVIARCIGASEAADAFFVAFRIPQFFRRLFAEGAFAQALVPVLAEYQQQRRDEGELIALRELLNAVSGLLGATLLVVVSAAMWFAPGVALLFAPGFADQPAQLALTADLLRVTLPYVLLVSLAGFAGAILNSQDRFVLPALMPLLLNIALVGAGLLLVPAAQQPVLVLAWAVLVAGVAQLLLQLPALAREQLLPVPRWQPAHPGVVKLRRLLVPALFAVSVTQVNLLLDTVLASLLDAGSVSWLYYSDRLAELPLGVFGIAIATVILPSLSRLAQLEDHAVSREPFRQTLGWALRCIVALALPASVALLILAEPILYLLFQYQAMQPDDVLMSAHSLRAYALGLLAFIAIKVFASGLYSQQAVAVAWRIAVSTVVCNLLLSAMLAAALQAGFGVGHVGLALGTSLAAAFNAWLLYRALRHSAALRGAPILLRADRAVMLKVLVACLVMGLLLYSQLPPASFWPEAGAWQRGQVVLGLCVAGLLAYGVSLAAMGLRPGHFRLEATGPAPLQD